MSKKVTTQQIISLIQERAENSQYFVVAISGFGGSGKSTLAKIFSESLKDSIVISLDSFILNNLNTRSSNWNNFDWSRLINEVLDPIKKGKQKLKYGIYNWNENKVIDQKDVVVPKYIIVEGVGLLRDELKDYFDLSVWIDIPLGVATQQGKRRDKEEYKVDNDKSWDEIWTPNDLAYYESYNPQSRADLLIKLNEIKRF